LQIWFTISLIGFIAVTVPYSLSLEHLKLEDKYGKQKGKKIGEILGMISGWGFFLFLFGIWLSPQDRFNIPFFQNFSFQLPILNVTVFLINFLIFAPFFIAGAWFGIKGVMGTCSKTSETLRENSEKTKKAFNF
jgi:hypothetical protein